MIGRRQQIHLQLSQLVDTVLTGFVFWLSYLFRVEVLPFFSNELPTIPEFNAFVWQLTIIVPFTPLLLEFEQFYKNPGRKTVWTSARQAFRALAVVALALGACIVLFKWGSGSRIVMVTFFPMALVALLTREAILRAAIKHRRLSGGPRDRVVFAGVPSEIERLQAEIGEDDLADLNIIGVFDLENRPVPELVDTVHEHNVSRVIFAVGHLQFEQVQRAVSACELEGVEAWLTTSFLQTHIARPDYDVLGQQMMLVFRTTPAASWPFLLKNLIDRVGAFILIFVTSPLWLLAAIGVRMSGAGPVFFRQERCGRHGAPFRMLKFRTMVNGAESQRDQLAKDNEMDGPVFKLENDPRVTRFGKFLRNLSIDELPQLINVLRGEMSLVGPRPLPVFEINQISDDAQRRRLSVKPGITCLWQVSGRNRISSFEEWVELDLDYIDNWSIWLDVKILFRTIPAVVSGSGAS